MKFKWEDYLHLAENLCEQGTEAHYRAAISRAYYAVFNILKLKADYKKSGGSFHQDFINYLKNPDDELIYKLNISLTDLGIIAYNLGVLREDRNNADYSLLPPRFDKVKTLQSIEKAQNILQICKEAEV